MQTIFIMLLSDIDPDVYKAIFFILLVVLLMQFILVVLKKMLDHKLKNKIIDKEVSEELATSILHNQAASEKHSTIKWFVILLTTGIGLFIADQYLPLGIHSIGIMAISIAIGFLSFSFYLKHSDK